MTEVKLYVPRARHHLVAHLLPESYTKVLCDGYYKGTYEPIVLVVWVGEDPSWVTPVAEALLDLGEEAVLYTKSEVTMCLVGR